MADQGEAGASRQRVATCHRESRNLKGGNEKSTSRRCPKCNEEKGFQLDHAENAATGHVARRALVQRVRWWWQAPQAATSRVTSTRPVVFDAPVAAWQLVQHKRFNAQDA